MAKELVLSQVAFEKHSPSATRGARQEALRLRRLILEPHEIRRRDLELGRHGVRYVWPENQFAHAFPDGKALVWSRSLEETVRRVSRFSKRDAETVRELALTYRRVLEEFPDAWIEDQDYKDPDTGQLMNRELLNQELSKIEKPAGIANPKDFRNEVVKFALRARAARTRADAPTSRHAMAVPSAHRTVRDVVCGMTVAEADAVVLSHEGRKLYFCSDTCRRWFEADPGRFAGALQPRADGAPDPTRAIAYLSMEVAVDPAMPTYAGGLGVLAGDTLKTFADLQKTFRRDRQKRSPGPPLRLNVKVQTLGDDNRIDSDILRLTWVGDLSVRGEIERLLYDPDLSVRTEALLYIAYHAHIDPLERIEQIGNFHDFSIRSASR